MFSKQQLLCLLLTVHLAAATITIVVPSYKTASYKVREVVDKMMDNYRRFSQLELINSLPRIEELQKCNRNKIEFAYNLNYLLKETKIQIKNNKNEECKISIDTKEGQKIWPYLMKTTGKQIDCQMMLTAASLRIGIKQKYTESVNRMLIKLSQHPEFNGIVKTIRVGARNLEALQNSLKDQKVWLRLQQQYSATVNKLLVAKLGELKIILPQLDFVKMDIAMKRGLENFKASINGKDLLTLRTQYVDVFPKMLCNKIDELKITLNKSPDLRNVINAVNKATGVLETMKASVKQRLFTLDLQKQYLGMVTNAMVTNTLDDLKIKLYKLPEYRGLINAVHKGTSDIKGALPLMMVNKLDDIKFTLSPKTKEVKVPVVVKTGFKNPFNASFKFKLF